MALGRSRVAAYAATVRRVLERERARKPDPHAARNEERLVFVVGSPRSGTTFLGRSLGSIEGFADLTEVTPLKSEIAKLLELPEAYAAARIRTILQRVRTLARVRGARCIEQTPETAFVLPAALLAFPEARALHVVRDGRDVVCSLLERGWLSAGRAGFDDARRPYGPDARFWVEPGRRAEFESGTDAARAAWAWRAYVSAASLDDDRVLTVRYEDLGKSAASIGAHLELAARDVARALSGFEERSIGRFRRDLSPRDLDDVMRVAGPLLRELGYADAGG